MTPRERAKKPWHWEPPVSPIEEETDPVVDGYEEPPLENAYDEVLFDDEGTAEMDAMPAMIVGGFTLGRPLAASEFAVVYRASRGARQSSENLR